RRRARRGRGGRRLGGSGRGGRGRRRVGGRGGGRRGLCGGRGGSGGSGTEGGEHHEPVAGRAEGQAPLLRPLGAGQDVLEEGGGAGVAPLASRDHGLVERSRRGHTSVVRRRCLQIGGRGRRHRDREARGRRGGVLPVVEGDVARSAERRRDCARPGAIDVDGDLHLARNVA